MKRNWFAFKVIGRKNAFGTIFFSLLSESCLKWISSFSCVCPPLKDWNVCQSETICFSWRSIKSLLEIECQSKKKCILSRFRIKLKWILRRHLVINFICQIDRELKMNWMWSCLCFFSFRNDIAKWYPPLSVIKLSRRNYFSCFAIIAIIYSLFLLPFYELVSSMVFL